MCLKVFSIFNALFAFFLNSLLLCIISFTFQAHLIQFGSCYGLHLSENCCLAALPIFMLPFLFIWKNILLTWMTFSNIFFHICYYFAVTYFQLHRYLRNKFFLDLVYACFFKLLRWRTFVSFVAEVEKLHLCYFSLILPFQVYIYYYILCYIHIVFISIVLCNWACLNEMIGNGNEWYKGPCVSFPMNSFMINSK